MSGRAENNHPTLWGNSPGPQTGLSNPRSDLPLILRDNLGGSPEHRRWLWGFSWSSHHPPWHVWGDSVGPSACPCQRCCGRQGLCELCRTARWAVAQPGRAQVSLAGHR